MADLWRQLWNYRLTTAEIIYRMPDHPGLLQTYVWQDLDLAPDFPVLKKFLDFWERNLDGRLHTVRVAHCQLIEPARVRFPQAVLSLH
ncbi:MAG: usg protein [Pseudomonadota bacterium]